MQVTRSQSGGVMHGVSWAYYVHTRDQLDNHVRVTYIHGDMEILAVPVSLGQAIAAPRPTCSLRGSRLFGSRDRRLS